jgi:hypothetical protein
LIQQEVSETILLVIGGVILANAALCLQAHALFRELPNKLGRECRHLICVVLCLFLLAKATA